MNPTPRSARRAVALARPTEFLIRIEPPLGVGHTRLVADQFNLLLPAGVTSRDRLRWLQAGPGIGEVHLIPVLASPLIRKLHGEPLVTIRLELVRGEQRRVDP